MKAIIFVAAVFAFCIMQIRSDDSCTDDNLLFIENCFNKTFPDFDFISVDAHFIVKTYNETRQHIDGVNLICKYMKTLKTCLTKDKNVVKNCLKIGALTNVDFVRNETYYAQVLMTILFETDYSCDVGYQALNSSFDCLQDAYGSCYTSYNGKKCEDNYVKCVTDYANDTCGYEAECYAKKDAAINVCFEEETQCGYCQTLDYNENPFTKLCKNDVYTLPPPTTTTTTTTTPIPPTTTTKNGGTSAQSLSVMTVIFLIGILHLF